MARSTSSLMWRNWAGTATATPARIASPSSVDELQAEVAAASAAGIRIRMVGSGHSFTDVAVTDGVMLTAGGLSGVSEVDEGTGHVTVLAGTTLHALGPALARHGLAMANLGDIDAQTIAGAVQTGTHGTGATLGGLASQVVGLDLVMPDGELVHASREQQPDLFDAARVGLGAFGIVAQLTIACVPAFGLHAVERPMPLERVLADLDELAAGNDHVEFYWFPHTRRTLVKQNNRVPAGRSLRPLPRVRGWIDDELLSNTVFEGLNQVATAVPRLTRPLSAVAARALSAREFSDASYRVFASQRRVVFREMEYALPREALADSLLAVESWIDTSGERVPFPVEVRVAAPDDAWLSTAYQRDSGYIAVHQYHRRDHRRYFAAVEAIMQGAGGRPHWGKLHGRDAESLREAYPRFEDAVKVRDGIDPAGVFGNPYVERVLGAYPE